MTVYISTGGFYKKSAVSVIENLKKYGITDIELSAGIYKKNLIKKLIKKKKFFNLKAHNYFPPPKKPFVLNMASLDNKIYKQSKNLILRGIKFSNKVKSNYYSFHSGFLCDILPDDLSRRIKKKKLHSRNVSIKLFVQRVKSVAKIAEKLGINLMIENNVITKNNLLEFGENPFLMTEPKECKKILSKLPKNVGMLLDVAHLKISAKTLGYDPSKMFTECKGRIFGYHLSENDGKNDTNKSFNRNSWFWQYLDKKINYISIEVYNEKPKKLLSLLNLTKSKFF
jgi:sugar phosphate isomerase/epimerase